jgi:hypothetical protein
MMRATLLCRSWLKRVFRVETPAGSFEVAYNGRGGWNGEAVYVDGRLAAHNPRLWFGPVFVFPLGPQLAAVEVRAWPWLTIRSFHLLVEDEVVYGEGIRRPLLAPGWADAERQGIAAARAVYEKVRQQLPWLPPADPGKRAGTGFRFRIDESFPAKPPIIVLVGQLLEGDVRHGDRIAVPLRGGGRFVGQVAGVLRGRLDAVSDSAAAAEALPWLGVGVNRPGCHTAEDIDTGVATHAEPDRGGG